MPKLIALNQKVRIEFEFDRAVTIGRHISNSLPLPDPEVSRRHVQIHPRDGHFVASDLESRNGLYINGKKCSDQVLKPGDEICVGVSLLFFDPPDREDLESLLSKRGSEIWKELGKPRAFKNARLTTFSVPELNELIEGWLHRKDANPIMPYKLRSPYLEFALNLGRPEHRGELAEQALDFLEENLGATRMAIMAVDPRKKNLDVLARRVDEDATDEPDFSIPKDVLRIVLDSEKGTYCQNCSYDYRFSNLVKKDSDYILSSFVATPIFRRGEYLGFLYLDQPAGAPRYDFKCLAQLHLAASLLGVCLHWRRVGPDKE